jgi:adenylate cyclase
LQDPAVDSLCYLALILWCRGYPDQAVQKSTEALALAEKLARPLSLAIAQIFAAQVHSLCQEWDLVLIYAEATIMLATEQELPQWGAYASIYRGWALAEQGHAIEGIAEIERGLALSRATGAEAARPWFLSALANAHLILGQPEKGLAVVEEALLLIDTKGERIAEVELYRLKGELLLTQEVKSQKAKSKKQKAENLDPQSALRNLQSEAETYFLRALTLAQQRDMKLWELRATVGLCRLWQTQGKRAEARQLLAPLFSWFTEGLATKDLQETRSLLEALETS